MIEVSYIEAQRWAVQDWYWQYDGFWVFRGPGSFYLTASLYVAYIPSVHHGQRWLLQLQ